MRVTATALHADIDPLLDRVLTTGEPLEIERGGRLLRVTAVDARTLAERFPPRPDLVCGDAGDLVDFDWSHTWQP